MKLIRFIKATASEISREIAHQLWMSTKNYHPDYLDFAEFLQDSSRHQRELLLTVKVQAMTDAEWEVFKLLHYK
jgi:hypothetical protein